MKKLRTTLTFECEDTVSASELRGFIKEALESCGGSRHPDDHLFGSLEKVKIGKFEREKMASTGEFEVVE